MDDVIGSAPGPRRRRRTVRLPAVPGTRSPLGRRLLAAGAALAVAATVVTAGRAGLDRGTAPAGPPPPTTRPVLGTLLQLAAGQDTVYALVEECRPPAPCRVALLSSGNDGRVWRELPLPGAAPGTDAVASWVLRVSGAEDQLSMEDPRRRVVHVGTSSFTTRPVVDGPPRDRVPATREPLVRLCAAPRCGRPAVEYLEARTGERSRLAVQPPFPPTVLAVEGAQLWVAGTDPATDRYAAAVSTDDGATWRAVPLPGVTVGDGRPSLVPVPEQDRAYLLLTAPDPDGIGTLAGLWSVPDPRTGAVPRQVRPEGRPLTVATAVGLRDGRLVLGGAVPSVVTPDGVVEQAAFPGPGAEVPPLPEEQLRRGPRGLVVAEAFPGPGEPGQIRLVVSATGNLDDWQLRPVTLPL